MSADAVLARLDESLYQFSEGELSDEDDNVAVLAIVSWYYCMYLDKTQRHSGLFHGADYAEHLVRSSEL